MKFKNGMKYLVSLLFIGGFATSLVAKENLALVVSTLNNPFFVALKDGAQKQAQALGYELVVLDSQNNPAKELANVEDILVKGSQLILINPTDSDAVGNAILAANRAKVPIMTIDRQANKGEIAAHIASDNVAGGQLAGDFLFNQLHKGLKVIQLEGIVGTSAARERGEGFKHSQKNHQFLVLASQPADFDRAKGMNVMQNLLTAHPEANAVFAQNDEMALGAIRAIKTAGRENMLVVGFDGTEQGIKAVKQGKLTATVAQQPMMMGMKGIEVADKLLKGETVEKQISVELKLITE